MKSATKFVIGVSLSFVLMSLGTACSSAESSNDPAAKGERIGAEESDLTSCPSGTRIGSCSGIGSFQLTCLQKLGCICCEPIPVVHSGTPAPWFQVIDIEYSVPGNNSQAAYSAGSYTGSHVDYQTTNSIGWDVELSGSLVDAEAKFTFGAVSGKGHGLQVTTATGSVVNVNQNDDLVHHEKDVFSVWVNPEVDVTTVGSTVTKIGMTAKGGVPDVETVTAEELLGQQPIASWKQLSRLTTEQRQSILSLDPFFAAGGFDPTTSSRFQYLRRLPLDGPLDPGGNPNQTTFAIESDMSTDTTQGWQFSAELTIKGSLGGIVKTGPDYQYQYQSIRTDTMGTQAMSSLTLGSKNQCVHVGVDVYRDRAFNTMIVVPVASDVNGVPSKWDCCDSSHSLCEPGAALDSSCGNNQCIASVCALDPFCCETTWDAQCVSEANACGSSSCLQQVCSDDPFCCTDSWDSQCVSEATACAPSPCGTNP